jgi:hypothetical protein
MSVDQSNKLNKKLRRKGKQRLELKAVIHFGANFYDVNIFFYPVATHGHLR